MWRSSSPSRARATRGSTTAVVAAEAGALLVHPRRCVAGQARRTQVSDTPPLSDRHVALHANDVLLFLSPVPASREGGAALSLNTQPGQNQPLGGGSPHSPKDYWEVVLSPTPSDGDY